MSSNQHPLTPDEFRDIYSKVPRLTVEIVLRSDSGVLLTLRNIEPCRGLWHLPGGTVRFAERLTEAVHRIALRELGIDVTVAHPLGYIEYPSHFQNGLDCPVGIAFEIVAYTGVIQPNEEADGFCWFTELPPEMHREQSDFLRSGSDGAFVRRPGNT